MARLIFLICLIWTPVWAAVPYDVELIGLEGDLADKAREVMRLEQLKDDHPASIPSLERRAENDIPRIEEVLRAEGYYQGEYDFRVTANDPRAKVEVTVKPGPVFLLESFAVVLDPQGPELPEVKALEVDLGGPARSDPILAAEPRIMKSLADQGYPLAELKKREVVVDHASQSMRALMEIDPGPLSHFGPVTITGQKEVPEIWVRNRIGWQEGDVFSTKPIEDLRQKLVSSRLFSSVRIETATKLENGVLPVSLTLVEGKDRTIGAGIQFFTNEGFSTNAFWEHRNLWGGAERLKVQGQYGQTRQQFDTNLMVPDVWRVDQNWVSLATAKSEETEAYETSSVLLQSGFEWILSPRWSAAAAVAFERVFETQEGIDSTYTLFSLPLEARYDSTDNFLDPSTGNRMIARFQPFFEEVVGTVGFQRVELYASQYLQVSAEPRIIAAGWANWGSIYGADLSSIPADKRFYVGGGGSVRGYGYQLAGPVDADNDPTGGLSALALGTELRWMVTDSIGVVPFIEGGQAFEGRSPKWDGDILWGAGLGVRYATPVGPVRADIAVPLNKRPGVDDSFQIYLSLGQAF